MKEIEYMKFLEDTVKELSRELKATTDCLAALSIRRTREMDSLMLRIDDIKYGKTGIQGQNNRNADKAAKARMLLDEYAAIEQGSSAIDHQTEIPDL